MHHLIALLIAAFREKENYIEREKGELEAVALDLRSGQVHEYREQDEDSIVRTCEDRQQGE